MSAPRLPCVALWDEMRAGARVVAGSLSGDDCRPDEIAAPHGPQCVPALPVAGVAGPDRLPSVANSPAGSEVLRNATAAGRDFRVVALPAMVCRGCGGGYVPATFTSVRCLRCDGVERRRLAGMARARAART